MDWLPSRRVVSAPFYLWIFRFLTLDIRGELRFEGDAFRWRPSGWSGRLSGRAPAFEVPTTEIGAMRLRVSRWLRSTLVFEDLGGNEIRADGNTTPIPLEVKLADAVAVFESWGWSRDDHLDGKVQRWKPPANWNRLNQRV